MTICDSTSAGLAFIYSDRSGRVAELVGAATPSLEWCRDLTHGLAGQFPRGGLWQADECGAGFRASRRPDPVFRRDPYGRAVEAILDRGG